MTDSKSEAVRLLDPFNAPEPSQETGPGAHFRSTFGPAPGTSSTSARSSTPTRTSLSSNNPFRDGDGPRTPPQDKKSVSVTTKPLNAGSPRRVSGPSYREGSPLNSPRGRTFTNGQSPPAYENVAASPSSRHSRSSSLRERFPGDESHKPLDIIRKDSQRAHRSPHLKKHHQPGADLIDRLDPAIGGHAYHHEGPYDAALLARNTSYKNSPVAALETSNAEALKATPAENIRDSIDRHMPLDGVASVAPGVPDRLGRTYEYEEGADLNREPGGDGPGYKRWADKDYSPDDLKGRGDNFELDRALQAHLKLDGDAMEMQDRSRISRDYHAAERNGTLDRRDPVEIAGGESKYVDLEIAQARSSTTDVQRTSSIRQAGESLKKRIGSLRKKKNDD